MGGYKEGREEERKGKGEREGKGRIGRRERGKGEGREEGKREGRETERREGEEVRRAGRDIEGFLRPCFGLRKNKTGPVGSNHTAPQPAGTQGVFLGDILVVVPG